MDVQFRMGWSHGIARWYWDTEQSLQHFESIFINKATPTHGRNQGLKKSFRCHSIYYNWKQGGGLPWASQVSWWILCYAELKFNPALQVPGTFRFFLLNLGDLINSFIFWFHVRHIWCDPYSRSSANSLKWFRTPESNPKCYIPSLLP